MVEITITREKTTITNSKGYVGGCELSVLVKKFERLFKVIDVDKMKVEFDDTVDSYNEATQGSTGIPKNIMIHNKGVASRISSGFNGSGSLNINVFDT